MSYIPSQDSALRAALISNFLVAELLSSRAAPDYTLWVVAPWVTNFALGLPSSADLTTLVDSAEPRPYLFEVLRQVASNGGRVAMVVRTEVVPNRVERFIRPLMDLVAEPGITVRQLRNLHAKIYVGQYGALYGSPNLTASGAEYNIEFSRYVSDVRSVSQLRAESQAIFECAEELAG
ncbi:MAG: hypothetical protein GY832_35335 [Chloroflexi bacterium]|nr:hypothetical protein [Chloroflexota bacterium]